MSSRPLATLGLLLVLGACASSPPGTKSASDMEGLLRLGAPWLLSTQFDTGLLVAHGWDQWRSRRAGTLSAVRTEKLTFATHLVPGGAPDRQSGLLCYPEPRNDRTTPVTWVVWTRATELERRFSPSTEAGSEVLFGRLLASLGYAVWMPDYAGMGDSAGWQTYCVPDSQALSAVDGLAAARRLLADRGRFTETGDLAVVGYSQGGQASMASARRFQDEPGAAPGLKLRRVYALAAPFDLMIGAGPTGNPDAVLDRPEYTVYLVLGWARAYPDQIVPGDILLPPILAGARTLFDGDLDFEELHRRVLKLAGKPGGGVTYRDLFRPDYLAAVTDHPDDVPYYRLQKAARLDRWLPGPDTELVVGATPADLIVSPQNAANARDYVLAQNPAALVTSWSFRSPTHLRAGAEGLFLAVLDLDSRPFVVRP